MRHDDTVTMTNVASDIRDIGDIGDHGASVAGARADMETDNAQLVCVERKNRNEKRKYFYQISKIC